MCKPPARFYYVTPTCLCHVSGADGVPDRVSGEFFSALDEGQIIHGHSGIPDPASNGATGQLEYVTYDNATMKAGVRSWNTQFLLKASQARGLQQQPFRQISNLGATKSGHSTRVRSASPLGSQCAVQLLHSLCSTGAPHSHQTPFHSVGTLGTMAQQHHTCSIASSCFSQPQLCCTHTDTHPHCNSAETRQYSPLSPPGSITDNNNMGCVAHGTHTLNGSVLLHSSPSPCAHCWHTSSCTQANNSTLGNVELPQHRSTAAAAVQVPITSTSSQHATPMTGCKGLLAKYPEPLSSCVPPQCCAPAGEDDVPQHECSRTNPSNTRRRRSSFPKSSRVDLQRHSVLNRFASRRTSEIDSQAQLHFSSHEADRKARFYQDWWRVAFETSGEDLYEFLLADMRSRATVITPTATCTPGIHSQLRTGSGGGHCAESRLLDWDEDGFDLGELDPEGAMVVLTAAA